MWPYGLIAAVDEDITPAEPLQTDDSLQAEALAAKMVNFVARRMQIKNFSRHCYDKQANSIYLIDKWIHQLISSYASLFNIFRT